MALKTTAPHHDDFASSSTVSCSASTSYVHYDIFVNHCGLDQEAGTFATALYSRLISRELHVFLDDMEYMFEEEVTSQMEAAISLASVQIAIFSPHYAHWKWCLDALVHMTKSGATVLPVFYKVRPSELRWTGLDKDGPYAEALRKHEAKGRYGPQAIQNWRDVLSNVSGLTGFELEAYNGDEEELLHKVVESVFKFCPHPHYDVFINHRGPDTKAILASPLYHRLISSGLRVFLDKQELVEGFKITDQIETAIQFSIFHIVIFSPTYARSSWCLDELFLMTKSRATILPVFYEVKPSIMDEVYAQALVDHENKGRYNSETIQRWRNALSEVAKMKGFEIDGNEGEVLDEIVQSVLKNVPKRSQVVHSSEVQGVVKSLLEEKVPKSSEVVQSVVESDPYEGCYFGLAEKLKDFEKAVLSQHEEQRMGAKVVGVVGAAGVGKTTLTEQFFNRKAIDYKEYAFLSVDVKGKGVAISPNHLQSDLIKRLKHTPSMQGIESLNQVLLKQLSSCLALIILDDVDQLDAFMLLKYVLHPKSLILVTSRDKDVLKRLGMVDSSIYHLTGLNRTHSQELLCSYAFRQPHSRRGFAHLVEEFLTACDGLPLSLKEFGVLLCGKDRCFWEMQLNGLHYFILPPKIYHRHKIIYDSLTQEEQRIFLDIACFLVGEDMDMAIGIWGLAAFSSLEHKFLVEVDLQNKIKMHNHLRGLGRDIAENLMTRDQFWHKTAFNTDDLLEKSPSVLSQFHGIRMIPTIDFRDISHETKYHKFKIRYASLNQEEQQIFLDIACFFIGQDSDKATRIWGLVGFLSLHNKRLVKVDHQNKIKMHHCVRDWGRNIAEKLMPRRLWHQTTNNSDALLEKSSSALSQYRGITLIPPIDFRNLSDETDACLSSEMSYFKRSSHEMFDGPKNLKFVAAQDGYVEDILRRVGSPDLVWLHWYKCPYSHLPSWIPMENLRVLEVAGTTLTELWGPESQAPLQLRELNILAQLSVFPKSIGQLKHLEKIVVKYFDDRPLPLETLPEEFCYLHSLKYLELRECSRMMSLPDRFGELTNLQYIDLKGASRLNELPSSFGNFILLKYLSLGNCCEIQDLLGLEHLTSLETLDVRGCAKLQSIPELRQFTKLQTLDVSGCREIQMLPGLEHLTSLLTLDVRGCENLQSIQGLGQPSKLQTIYVGEIPEVLGVEKHLTSLKTLNVRGCEKLQSIPGLGQLTKLQTLDVGGCCVIQMLPGLEHLTSLETLDVRGCKKLQSIPELGQLTKLQILDVSGCREIQKLPGLEHLTSLETFNVRGCENLHSIPGLGQLRKLQTFDVSGCRQIQTLPGLEHLIYLESLDVRGCEKLHSIPGLGQLRNLQTLGVSGCREIQRLPSLEHLTSLETLDVRGCQKLQSIPGLGQLRKLQTLDISGCREIQRLPGLLHLTSLEMLHVRGCKKLERIPGSGQLTKLQTLDVSGCREIQRLPGLDHLTSLEILNVRGCEKLHRIQGLGQLTKLGTLNVSGCPEIKLLPGVERLTSLETLDVRECQKLQRIPWLGRLTKLGTLNVSGCRLIKELQGVECLTSLETLNAEGCEKLQRLPWLGLLTKLRTLNVSGCRQIKELQGVECLTLETFNYRGCKKLHRRNTIVGAAHKLKH